VNIFLCTGNINRSAAAEKLAQFLYPNIPWCSAGTSYQSHNKPMAKKMRMACAKRLGLEGDPGANYHRSTPLSAIVLKDEDYVFCMAPAHLEHMVNKYPNFQGSLVKLWEFDPERKLTLIQDPQWEAGYEIAHKVLGDIERCLKCFFATKVLHA